jgi:hypothetical protein
MCGEDWFHTTEEEMKAYFAFCIIMTVVKTPAMKMTWSKRSIVQTSIFGKTIQFVRVLLIFRFLHFADNTTADANDKFRKVRSFMQFLNNRFKIVLCSTRRCGNL